MPLFLVPLYAACLVLGGVGVLAQSEASCLPYYQWTFNTAKQSPCEVASSSVAVCTRSAWPVNALPEESHYSGPTLDQANGCQCSTVVYSLMSACGACQGRSYLPWSVWSANCRTVYTGYPEAIPSDLAIPGWAYFDVKAQDRFDQAYARDHSNTTESTAAPSPTAASSSAVSISSIVSASSTSDVSPGAASVSRRVNAIGGGTVGAIFCAFVITIMAVWLIHKRHQRKKGGVMPRGSEVSRDAEAPPLSEGPGEKLPR